jgi:hypothetical protein
MLDRRLIARALRLAPDVEFSRAGLLRRVAQRGAGHAGRRRTAPPQRRLAGDAVVPAARRGQRVLPHGCRARNHKHPEELTFTQLTLWVHCWPAAAEALQNALARDPMMLRRFVNGDRWPPSPDGQSGPLVGLWLWTRPAYHLPANPAYPPPSPHNETARLMDRPRTPGGPPGPRRCVP